MSNLKTWGQRNSNANIENLPSQYYARKLANEALHFTHLNLYHDVRYLVKRKEF